LSGAYLDIFNQNVVTLVATIYAVKTEASVSHKNWCHSHSKVEFAQGFFHPTTAQAAYKNLRDQSPFGNASRRMLNRYF